MDDEMDLLLGEIPRGLLITNHDYPQEDWEQSYPDRKTQTKTHLMGLTVVSLDGSSSSSSSSSPSGGTSPTANGSPNDDTFFLSAKLQSLHVDDPYDIHRIWGSGSPPPSLNSLWSEPPPPVPCNDKDKPTNMGSLFMDQGKGSLPLPISNPRGGLFYSMGNANANANANGNGNGNSFLINRKQHHGCESYDCGYITDAGVGGCEDGYIIHGKGVEYYARRWVNPVRTPVRTGGIRGPRRYGSVEEVRGIIYLLAKDQQGCRFLQAKFDEGNAKDVNSIFVEIVYHSAELMVNPFANYLMQKLFCVCTEEQRMKVIAVVTEDPYELVRISLNQYGTRAVQKLIETLQSPDQIGVVMSTLRPGFLNLIKDPNGNHVVQRCLHCLGDEDIKFIFEAAIMHCDDIATHQHGCCVLQRCVARATGFYQTNLIMKIVDNGLLLAQDKFGNYVVQFIMELKIPQANDMLLPQFVGNFVELSKNKFSSNVVEKCLKLWVDCRSLIISELVSTPNFSDLLQHQYANYVIQAALSNTKGHLYQTLLHEIKPHESILATSPYCKRIFSRSVLRK